MESFCAFSSKFLFTFLWLLVKLLWGRLLCPSCAKANRRRGVSDVWQMATRRVWGGGKADGSRTPGEDTQAGKMAWMYWGRSCLSVPQGVPL